MPELQSSNEYTYIVRIYGEQAAQDARKLRTIIINEFVATERQMTQAVASTLDVISSQTRRLSYNANRISEVTRLAADFAQAWARALAIMSGTGAGSFDTLIEAARKAYDQIVGHSIFDDLYRDILAYYDKIAAASSRPFQPLVTQAQQAASATRQQIQGVVDATGKLRWPAGTTLGGKALGGLFTSQEQIDKYNAGLLRLNDIMPGAEEAIAKANAALGKQPKVIHNATEFMKAFTDELNKATLQYFGLRRLGYGFEQIGGQIAQAGRRNVQTMFEWARAYADFNAYATRAAAAMEMNAEQQEDMEAAVLADIDAMRLFDPEDIIDGLRVWAAGTGLVVRSEEDLQKALVQTRDIQLLAAFGSEQLAETMTSVGGGLAEFGLGLSDVERVTRLYNFTAAKTFAEVNDVGDAFRLVGPLAATLGISIEDTAAAIGLLSDENVKGTMAGRAFRQMLIQLVRPTEEHNEKMNMALGLNQELGETWQQIVFPEGEFIGIARYIDLIAAATERMTTEQKTNLLATMATANELQALVALVDAQTEARKEGINVLRAWVKWTAGLVDEEVQQFANFMERTRGVSIDTASNMFNFWDRQSQLFYESEAARADQLERRWKAMQIALGRIVLEEGAPVLDDLLATLEDLVRFAAEHPGLVKGAMIAAGAELVLGNLLRLSGQMLGMVANILILRGAFTGFGGAVGAFQMAVNVFSQAVNADIVQRRTSVPGAGPGTIGALGILAKLFPAALAIFLTDQPSERQKEYESLLETLRDLNVTADQWEALFNKANLRWKEGMGAEYGRARELITPEGAVLDVRGVLEYLEQMELLTQEQQEFLDQLREGAIGVDVEMGELPYELQGFLDGTAEGSMTIFAEIVGLDPTDIEAVQMYDAMMADLTEITRSGTAKIDAARRKFIDQSIQDWKNYNDKRIDLVQKFTQKERDYWQDHLDKLADIEADGRKRVAKLVQDLQKRLNDVRQRTADRVTEIEDEQNDRLEELRKEHLKNMRRMEEDHRDTLLDLAIKRDAYGIWQEMRDYTKRKRRAEEDYQDRVNNLKEANRKRIKEIQDQGRREEEELRKQHAEQLKEIQDDIEARLDAEDKAYDKARKRRLRDHKQQLTDLKKNFDDQKKERRAAYRTALTDLSAEMLAEFRTTQNAKTQELLMLRGMYSQGQTDWANYLQWRLDALNRYLQAEQNAWTGQEAPPPTAPAPGTTPPTGPYRPPRRDRGMTYEYAPLPQQQINVVGDMSLQIDVKGEIPEESKEEFEKGVQMLFDSVVRRLEVSYG